LKHKRQYVFGEVVGIILLLFIVGVSNPIISKQASSAVRYENDFHSLTQDQDPPEGSGSLPFPITQGDDPTQVSSPLHGPLPQNIQTEVEFDSDTKLYTVYFKVGDMNIQPPRIMSEEEYRAFQFEQSMRNYWQQRRQGDKFDRGAGILPRLEVGGETLPYFREQCYRNNSPGKCRAGVWGY
jgi:hypothetical protein